VQLFYPIAKTLAEKSGWEFAKETGFDVVMINPGTALGPLLPPTINSSMAVLVSVLRGLLKTEMRDLRSMHIICMIL